jgi:citrate synthase
MTETVTLMIDGKTHTLPVVQGTEGERAIDISKLRAQTGLISLDPGYGNTGSCESAITFIDGEKGVLRYRGIPIEQFEQSPNFVEVAWLLIFGKLPSQDEYARFSALLAHTANIDETMRHAFHGLPRSSPPMAILSAMINTLSCFHPEFQEVDDPAQLEAVAARLISKIRTIAAYSFRRSRGKPLIYPDPKLRYVPSFLHMMFSQPYEEYVCDNDTRDAFNLLLILHADHEQNCSTSTVRMVGSSQANLFASCAAGIGALWGPLHGGANVQVLEMLEQIHVGKMTPEEFVRRAKDKESGARLMGFGHRVYKNFDPRAKVLQRMAERLFRKMNKDDPLLTIARRLEEIALSDSYFIDRHLYPNVDFYSGIILRAIGIPVNMFTVVFAIGRMPGWIAHWAEQHQSAHARIARPRQIYTGNLETQYVSRIDLED